MAFSTNQQIVVDLFIAAYGRAPAQGGLDFFTGQLDSGAMTSYDIANFMADTQNNTEAALRFSDTGSTEDKVNSIFQNVLGRGTASQEGLEYWSNRVDNEDGYTLATLMHDVINSAKNSSGDGATLANKSQVVEYFLSKVPVSEQGGKQVKTDTVVTNEDVVTAKEKVDVMVTVSDELGKIIVITDGGNYDGTDGDDTFITSRGEIDGVVIQAKGGDDILNSTVSGGTDNENDTGLALISYDLETVNLRNLAGGTTLDLLQANGLEEVWNDRSSSSSIALTLDNVSTDVTVGIKKTSSATKVNYEDVSGDADTVNVKLDGTKEGASLITPNVEIINLAVASNDSRSYLDISDVKNSALETINITSVVDKETELKLKDSSTLTITGGEGEETLVLSHTVLATTTKVENVELEFTAAATFEAVNLVDVTNIKVDATHVSANVISNLLADTDLTVVGDVKTSLEVSFDDATSSKNSLKMELDSLETDATVLDVQTVDKLIVDTLETLNFSVLGDSNDSTTIAVLEADTLKTLDIDSQESSFEITAFTDSATLKSIDATGFDGALTLGALNNTSGVNITLGNQNSLTTEVSLTLGTVEISDTITFGNALVGDITIHNFEEGEQTTGDNLDFSVYGVENMGDLIISSDVADDAVGDITITVHDNANFGSITLTGVILNDLDENNFEFA